MLPVSICNMCMWCACACVCVCACACVVCVYVCMCVCVCVVCVCVWCVCVCVCVWYVCVCVWCDACGSYYYHPVQAAIATYRNVLEHVVTLHTTVPVKPVSITWDHPTVVTGMQCLIHDKQVTAQCQEWTCVSAHLSCDPCSSYALIAWPPCQRTANVDTLNKCNGHSSSRALPLSECC